MSRWFRTARFVGAGVVVVSLLAAGCSSDDDGSSSSSDDSTPAEAAGAEGLTGAAFVEPGPYEVGVTSLELASGARLQVWYPADAEATEGLEPAAYDIQDEIPPDLLVPFEDQLADLDTTKPTTASQDVEPSGDGPFPYVLSAHGAGGFPNASSNLTTHLASWGFVVAAPEFLTRSLIGFLGGGDGSEQTDAEVVAETAELVGSAGGPLDGLTDTGEQAVFGQSAGAGTAAIVSTAPETVTYVPMSGGAFRRDESTPDETDVVTLDLGDIPSLWITGEDDGIAELEGVQDSWAQAAAPTRLVVIEGAGHQGATTDICDIGEIPGGPVGLALEVGFPVPDNLRENGLDGCVPEGLDTEVGTDVVNQALVAQVRWAYGIDDEPVGLDAETLNSITPLVYEERL